MPTIKAIAKSLVLLVIGREAKPRRILRGLACGCRIHVSPAEHLSYLFGTAEPHLQRAIRQYVSAGDIVYDIGANIGYVSPCLAKRVGPRGRVIAFEPVSRNVDLLRANVKSNALQNVEVFDVAASDRAGEAVIRILENFSTPSLVWHRKDPGAVELVVKTVAIDDLIEAGTLPLPKFVKIDVEGAEGLALTGMRRMIARARPVLFIENSDAGRSTTWEILRGMNYRCQSALTCRPVTGFDQYRHSDFLWIPSERDPE